jgi:hypothetical protein
MSDYFTESETWIKYDWHVDSDPHGYYYEVDIKEVHISGHQFESWPFEFEAMQESKIIDSLIEEYGVPGPPMQRVLS